MQWDASPTAGFTWGDPWLPVGSSTRTVNVAAQSDDPRSMLAFYRRLIAERRRSLALRRGSYATLPGLPQDVFGYARDAGDDRRLIVLNFGAEPVTIDRDRLGPAPTVILAADPDRSIGPITGPLRLSPDDGVLVAPG